MTCIFNDVCGIRLTYLRTEMRERCKCADMYYQHNRVHFDMNVCLNTNMIINMRTK